MFLALSSPRVITSRVKRCRWQGLHFRLVTRDFPTPGFETCEPVFIRVALAIDDVVEVWGYCCFGILLGLFGRAGAEGVLHGELEAGACGVVVVCHGADDGKVGSSIGVRIW